MSTATHHDSELPPRDRSRHEEPNNPLWVWVFLVVTLVLAGAGFVFKLVEFVWSWATTDGMGFAIVPVFAYLAITGGYVCFFVWACRRRMFHDIEGPKHRMLELQGRYDRGLGYEPEDASAESSDVAETGEVRR